MSKILVIGDIHNKTEIAELYLKSWGGKVVFVGDYFDDFYDTPDDAIRTAEWLKDSLTKPERIHLMGNHDFHYMMPIESNMYCSGYSPDKHKVIQNILTNEDWSKVKYFHAENDCWFSHAGITYNWFSHPIYGTTKDTIESIVAQGILDIQNRIYDGTGIKALYAADRYRGGRFEKGGLLWNDWRNADFFPGITQIVGHTPRDVIKRSERKRPSKDGRKKAFNINVDTHLQQAIILNTEDSSYEVLNINDF
jgi:hypothetical protein